jgi:predicted NAD/FAD-binding protein/cyclopropane fatty-acyl-phospholipid synthase-like methyltransferase
MFSSAKKEGKRAPSAGAAPPSPGASPGARAPPGDGRKRVAVVGSGIAGLSAAYLAHRNGHDVTLFERDDVCGGHALTVDSSVGPVDLGFQVRVQTFFFPLFSSAEKNRHGIIPIFRSRTRARSSSSDHSCHHRVLSHVPHDVTDKTQVFNLTTYPHLVGLFSELGVRSEKSDMSFALSTNDVEWGSLGLSAVFAQKRNLLRPAFWNMIREILRFGKEAPRVLSPENAEKYAKTTLGEYLSRNKYSSFFVENYVVPMCAAIWSCSDEDTMAFPIVTLIRFWVNHHLLNIVERPLWRVVKGRSKAYVDAVVAALPRGAVELNADVTAVRRHATGAKGAVSVTWTRRVPRKVPRKVPRTRGSSTRSSWRPTATRLWRSSATPPPPPSAPLWPPCGTSRTTCTCTRTRRLCRATAAAWASWNCLKGEGRGTKSANESVCVTYWVNLLQNLPKDAPDVFVTLNPPRPPKEGTVEHKVTLAHPLFDANAIEAQSKIKEMQGSNNVWFAGAWCGYGFHEDGIKSAVDVAEGMLAKFAPNEKKSGNELPALTPTTKTRATPWVPRSCDPHLTLTSRVCVPLFARVAGAWVPPGRVFKMLLPNGDELVMRGALDQRGTSLLGKDGKPVPEEITVRVYEQRLFVNAVTRADIGLGESYMNGDFDFESGDLYDLLDLFCAGHPANVGAKRGAESGVPSLGKDIVGFVSEAMRKVGGAMEFAAHAALSNTKEGSKRNIEYHYDAGNAFYSLFLDSTMLYSSGIHGAVGEPMDVGKALGSIAEDDFAKREAHLEAAQYAKIDAMIDRLGLKPGDKKRVLEIGCGWGALAIRLCERFPLCKVTGLTLSNEQHAEATKRVAAAGLSDRIEIVIRDYRDVTEIYDAVISIEMLEAVGHEHLPTYFNAVSKALRPDGVASIQVITMPDERYASYCASESDFIRAYIFPGGHLPSVGAMKHAASPNGLSLRSFDDIGEHYAVTLRLWRERMMARRDVIVGELGYSEKFVRMFEFYFAYCEAGFARGLINDLQMTWVKTGDAKSLKAETSQGSKSAAEIAAAGDARRVSVLAVFSYVAFAAYEAASKGIFEALTNATHIFGVVFCTLLIAATHAVVFVAYAGAFAAVGAAGDKTKTKTQKPQTPSLVSVDSRRVASPAGAAAVRCAVAFAAVLSVTEKLTAVSFMSTGVAGLTEAFRTAFLGSNTPVQENLTATLATLGAASAAFASLVSSALASGSSNDPITRPTPGVTRSVRDVQVLTSNKIVDAFILLVCVFRVATRNVSRRDGVLCHGARRSVFRVARRNRSRRRRGIPVGTPRLTSGGSPTPRAKCLSSRSGSCLTSPPSR